MFVDVAFPISRYQVFTYQVPEQLCDVVVVGTRVRAPFGKRSVPGIVVGTNTKTQYKGKIKDISDVIDDQPVLDEKLWKLLNWMSKYYLTPLGKTASVIPSNLSTKYKPRETWVVELVSSAKIPDDLESRAPVQFKILSELSKHSKPIPVTKFNMLAASPLTVCKSLAAKGIVKLSKEERLPETSSFSFEPIHKEITFSDEQKSAINQINNHIKNKKYGGILLHGVTGSGKTEIYIKIVQQTLDQNRTAIILLPEIALTPQIAGRFRAVFGDTVALWHSKLTGAARAWTWKNICQGRYKVVIGARSAIFAPLKDLGLIVIDEEQELSYKQESPSPRYNAREVALMRGKIHDATVLLASATPGMESYHNQIMGKLEYCYLAERYGNALYPMVTVVDMLKEQEETGKIGQIFSGVLQKKIEQRLEKKEQVILLQNRRGFAPIFRCGDCGEILQCPTCSIPLTYHRVGEKLECHFCGYVQRIIPTQCDSCSSTKLKLSGTGTQKVEDIVAEIFPQANLARLDVDTARTGKALTNILKRFADGKIDILLGTQMIAKGLDFENVTLVGIINADTGLFLPDFRSGERVFQLIYQAAGRSGRHDKPGEVVVQTYNSDSPVIRYATRLDLKKYYNIVLSERQELNYPPFSWMAKIEFSGKKKQMVEQISSKIARQIRGNYRGLNILGPAWCYRERLRGNYRKQIIFKSLKNSDPNGSKLHTFLNNNFLQQNIGQSIKGVRISIDINPVSLL